MSLYLIPAALSAAILAIHFFIGGREVVEPLLNANELSSLVRYTHYHCWHLVSITLLALFAAYLAAALMPSAEILALFATVQATAFAVWGLALNVSRRLSHKEMPQWILFFAVIAAGYGAALI